MRKIEPRIFTTNEADNLVEFRVCSRIDYARDAVVLPYVTRRVVEHPAEVVGKTGSSNVVRNVHRWWHA